MKKFVIIVLMLFTTISVFNLKKNQVIASTNEKEIVIEMYSGRIIHQKNIDERAYPASTTKILTAICVIENTDIEKIVQIPDECVGVEGSSIYLRKGEKLKVKEILYGLMLRSGNDCAVALSIITSGSQKEFVKLMNETAKKIGADNSNFMNPHGLHDDNHYVTARDLAKITAYAMKNNIFREIVSTKKIEIPNGEYDYNRVLINKNKMLFECDGATGVKTGFTKKAGRCLVSACNRNNTELICVVLNCSPMFEKSKQLFDDLYNDYVTHKILESDFILDFIPTENGEKVGVYLKNDILLPLRKSEIDNLKIKYILPEKIKSGTKKDEEVGKVEIYIENDLIFFEKIYTINDVK